MSDILYEILLWVPLWVLWVPLTWTTWIVLFLVHWYLPHCPDFFFFFLLITFLLHVVYHVLTSIQNDIYVIEALTQLHQRHFQMHILGKWLCIWFNFTEFCSFGCNWWWVIIDSGNGLVPNRHQAITWTNNDTIHGYIYASPGLNKLTHLPLVTHICVGDLGQHWFR